MRFGVLVSTVALALEASAAAQLRTLNLSQDLVRLGIAASNMSPNQVTQDAGPLLSSGVAYASSHQIGSVIADPGAYYFASPTTSVSHVSLVNASNLTIDFQGSDLLFGNEHRVGIALRNCTNLVLQNLNIDYQQPPFTQVQVTSVDAAKRQIHFTIPAGWRDPSSFSASQSVGGAVNGFYVFIFRNGRPAPNFGRMQFQTPTTSNTFTIVDDGTSSSSAATIAQIRSGDMAVLAARDNLQALFSSKCSGCTLRNIRVYSSPGVGVVMSYPEATLMDHVYAMPKPGTDRLVSTNADGLTFAQPGSRNTLRLSRAIRTQDDGFSPHSLIFGMVQSQSGATLQVQPEFTDGVENESPVVFQDVNNGNFLGNSLIVSQNPAPTQPPNSQGPITVMLSGSTAASVNGAAIYTTDPEQRGNNTTLDRVTAQNQTFARGISLWGLMNSSVTGSYIRHTPLSGIDGIHQLNPNDWMSPPLVNLTLTNNVIDGTNSESGGALTMGAITVLALNAAQTPMPSDPHRNVMIGENFIADSGFASIWAGNVNGGSISGNYLIDPNGRGANPYNPKGLFSSVLLQPIVIETSENVSAAANTVDQTSSRMFLTDTSYSELAAYAPGGTYRLSAYNLGTLQNLVVSLTDSSGNVNPVAVKNVATHSLNVVIPANAALGGAHFTLTSGSSKYFATLFLDSQDNIPSENGCTYAVSPAGSVVAGGASSLPVLVITQADCAYQILATDSFVAQGAAASGTGVINVALAANSGAARNTSVEIAGVPIAITQASGAGPTITGVVNGASFLPNAAPAAWITIQGTNLSKTTRQWTSGDFNRNNLPTMLDGVGVTINGKAAYIYYVSPTQLNVLSPNETNTGAIQVQVTNSVGTSQTFTVNESPFQPALFLFNAKYPAAVHLNGGFVGPTDLIHGGNFSPVSGGETIEIFGTGFGPTMVQYAAGMVLAAPVALANPVSVTIGGVAASVLFAGVTSNGLVQLNVTVPKGLSSGDAPVVVTVNNQTTQTGLYLTVRN